MSINTELLLIGQQSTYGMDGDRSVFQYTVPAGHTLVCYSKFPHVGGVWAVGGTGDYKQFNGWWSGDMANSDVTFFHEGSSGGESVQEGTWQHRYCLMGFNGTGTFYDGDQPHHSTSYGWVWALTKRLVSNPAPNLTYEMLLESPSDIICYAKNSTQYFDEIGLTRFNTGYSGTPPTFQNLGFNLDYKYYATLTKEAVNHSVMSCSHFTATEGEYVKEVFHEGDVIRKDGHLGFIELRVLLLDAEGKPVPLSDTYNSAVGYY